MAVINESLEIERRKIVAKSLPFMLNALWEAHSLLSPASLASRAALEYAKFQSNNRLKEEEIQSLLRQVGHIEFRSEGTGRISITLTREELLELIGSYLVGEFLNEGGSGEEFATLPKNDSDFDGMLKLPDKTIYAKLLERRMDRSGVYLEIDKAQTMNPSEVWIFSCSDELRSDVLFAPIFLSESMILRGRFRLMPITDVLNSITKGRFSASIIKRSAETDNELPGEGFCFLFAKRSENHDGIRIPIT